MDSLFKKILAFLLPERWYAALSALRRERPLVDRSRVILYASPDLLPAYPDRCPMDLVLARPPKIQVALVSTCLNEAGNVQNWLESLVKQSRWPDEMILTDGGSTDGTVEIIQRFSRDCPFKITLIQAPGANISRGRNLAIKQAVESVIIVTDFGCTYEQDWLERLVYPFEVNDEIDVSCGFYQALVTKPFDRISASFIIRKLENVDPSTILPSSRCIAFRRKIWAMVGGYPEWLTNEGEDTLFDYRAKLIKSTWAFVPSARVAWRPPGTLNKMYKTIWHYARGDGESGILASHYWYFIRLAILWDLVLLVLLAMSFWLVSVNEWTRLGLILCLMVLGGAWLVRGLLRMPEKPQAAAAPFREFLQIRAVAAVIFTARNFGFLCGLWNRSIARQRQEKGLKGELQDILAAHPQRKAVILYPPTHDWGFMFQRPHQMARAFAKAGYLFFFCTDNQISDGIEGFYQVEPYLYLAHFPLGIFAGLSGESGISGSMVYIGSPWHRPLVDLFKNIPLIYDHYDDIEVSGGLLADHRALLESASVVLVTSERLRSAVKDYRPDAVLVPNGVDYDFIQACQPGPGEEPPPDMAKILALGKPVVGYSGALAEWFDYDLLRQAADARPNLEFVLLGVDYDGSLGRSGVLSLPNVSWLGMKSYSVLFKYVWRFDLATIPFKINEITLATSPIKLFEYLACRKQVITTPLPECIPFQRVRIIQTGPEYIQQLDEALAERMNPVYQAWADTTARENTWDRRARQVLATLRR